MRAAGIVLGFGTAFAVIATVAAGCGGGTTASNPVDSGSGADVTMEAAPEAAAEAAAEAAVDSGMVMDAACVPDADLNNLPIPDAALGDSGANAGACLACLKPACPAVISACNQSCACVSAFESFAMCIETGGGLQGCASTLVNAGIPVQNLACALPCATACGVTLPMGDSGMPETSTGDSGSTTDGASDATAD